MFKKYSKYFNVLKNVYNFNAKRDNNNCVCYKNICTNCVYKKVKQVRKPC